MKTLGALAAGCLLASGIAAVPAAGVTNTAVYPLASSATTAEVATFWLGNGGATLTNATPYAVQTVVGDVVLGGGVVPDAEPGSIPPLLPPDSATGGNDKAPVASGKVFFVGADGQPHWCSATAVQSQYRNLVATAGHCAYDTQRSGVGLDKWVFVPGNSGLYVGKQAFTHADFPTYDDYDRDYAFVNVYNGVTAAPTGELTDTGRLGDNVGGQGLAWNQPLDSTVDVFGFPVGANPDDALETSSGRTAAAQAPSLNAEQLVTVDSRVAGSLGSSWLSHYDKNSRVGYLNALTISVADTDGNQRYDKSFSPYFDGALAAIHSAASGQWTGSVLPA